MNVRSNVNSDLDLDDLGPSLEKVETAAPAKKIGSFSSPLDQVKRGFYHIIFNGFSTFRAAMVGSLLNETALTELETSSVADETGYDISALAQAVTMQKLREWMRFKPGNGKDFFEVSFIEDMYNIDSEVVQKIIGYMPKEATKNGMPLDKFIDAIEKFGVSTAVSAALESQATKLKEQFIDTLDDLVEFRIRIERKVFNEANNKDSLIFHFSIRTDASVYKEVVESERFEPYLLYLWVYNMMTANEKSGRKVISPRITAAHYQSMSKFAQVRPKVNERGFALADSGLPIFVPPNVNVVDKFLEAANSAVDEDGVFQPSILAEDKGFANRLVYVDWINDIMAYTTATGKLESYNLGQVHPLDKASEYMILETPMRAPIMRRVYQTLSISLNKLNPPDAEKYVTSVSAKTILQNKTADQIFLKVMQSGLDNTTDVKLKHLAGSDLEDYEETPDMAHHILALKALMALLYDTAKTDPTSVEVPSSYKSQGLLFRLIGVEYTLQVGAKMDAAYVAEAFDAYVKEREKAKVDLRKKSFDIPNIVIGDGVRGLLPHQGRIISCTEKTPSMFMLPVETGGGKTIISAVTAIKAIENVRSIPMITTKGNLVKGTITELNQITQGKINAIPFRPTILRNMKRITPIKTFALFLEWYRKLPPNTILVNSYSDFASRRKLFEDLDTVDGFADSPVYTTQYLLMIKLLGIKTFIGDESHMIKNPDSARSRNSYAAFSQGDVRGEMSGTMVSNTVVDLVGQARGISPLIFGSDPEIFADAYGVSTGLLKSDEDARIIKDRMRSTTAYHEAFREDWSYMLPTKDDSFVYAELTAKQQEFYNILMQEAYLMLVEEEKRKGKKAKLESESEDDDDDEDEDDDEDDEEDEDGALIAKAKTHLQKVEEFLVAPDENEQYMKWDKRPDGVDIISPKVTAADNLIEEHLRTHKGNLSKNKVIIFGWNRAASKHFMKYSRFAGKTLHYTAGDEEVMRRFETDETVVLMAADEGSVREGFNLQMTSLIIRQQSVWAPGDHEQTIARMYRPDPRGKYNRDNVTHKWVLCKQIGTDSPTLDMVKMARLVSKSVSNARLKYEGKIEWRSVSKEFDDMKLFKMNLNTIFNANPAEVQEYLEHWDTFVSWENGINTTAKYRLAKQLEAQFNVDLIKDGKILDINEFIKLAMSELKSTYDIQGSRRVWVPWAPNALPPDPKKWGFSVLGQRNIPVGTVVYTSFGPGIVTNVLSKGIKVKIYDGRIIGQKKSSVMLVADHRYKDLQAVVKDPTKWQAEALDVGGVKGAVKDTTKLPDKEEVIDTLDEEVIEDDDAEEKVDIEVVASIMNGWPALMVLDDIPQLKGISDWKRIDPFLSIHFRTWQALDSFINLLHSKTYMSQETLDAIDDEIEELKTGKAMVLGKQINPKSVRQFFQDQHKKLGKKGNKAVAKPYFIAVEREVKLAFDIDSHEPQVISWLLRSKEKIPGIKSIRKNGAIWINTFTSAKEAYEDLDSLNNIINVDKQALREDLVAIRDEIRDLRKARSKPSV